MALNAVPVRGRGAEGGPAARVARRFRHPPTAARGEQRGLGCAPHLSRFILAAACYDLFGGDAYANVSLGFMMPRPQSRPQHQPTATLTPTLTPTDTVLPRVCAGHELRRLPCAQRHLCADRTVQLPSQSRVLARRRKV